MVNRTIRLSKSHSFFVFGPRGSGKSTLIKSLYSSHENVLYIDLLRPKTEDGFRRDPDQLVQLVEAQKPSWVIIDEIQKLPKLLDLVHFLIEENSQKFILAGSSARKLKRGAANLLAGRAFVYHLHPFTAAELGGEFDLMTALQWGLLPKIYSLSSSEDRKDFLESYCMTYLKEEIQQEQIVRNLDPFRDFLEVSAQMNGKVVNYSKIAKDIGVDTTTVQNYFSILEDTLVGFLLPAYHKSIRKRQRHAPKFYYFDPGISRALNRTLDIAITERSFSFGNAFEHFLILEIKKLSDYHKKSWNFSYLLTKDDVEIDLIIEESRGKTICIEIKSTNSVKQDDIKNFINLTADFKNSQSLCLSNDPKAKKMGHVLCLHWKDGLKKLGL